MQDRPSAAELLDAIRDFLEREILPELEGRRRFHLRVALNALGILRREHDLEESAVRAEIDRLNDLLGLGAGQPATFAAAREAARALNVELARRIRSGEMDDRWSETLEVLRRTSADRIAVANPRYAEDSSPA